MINFAKMGFNPELIGIVATLFIVFAFSRTGEKEIRIYDLIGAALFVIYGLIIGSLSTVLLNIILVIIQIYKLIKLKEEDGYENKDITFTEHGN